MHFNTYIYIYTHTHTHTHTHKCTYWNTTVKLRNLYPLHANTSHSTPTDIITTGCLKTYNTPKQQGNSKTYIGFYLFIYFIDTQFKMMFYINYNSILE